MIRRSFFAVSRAARFLFTSMAICSTEAPCLRHRQHPDLVRAQMQYSLLLSFFQCTLHRIQMSRNFLGLARIRNTIAEMLGLRSPFLGGALRTRRPPNNTPTYRELRFDLFNDAIGIIYLAVRLCKFLRIMRLLMLCPYTGLGRIPDFSLHRESFSSVQTLVNYHNNSPSTCDSGFRGPRSVC